MLLLRTSTVMVCAALAYCICSIAQEHFLQRRAGVSASHRKRPEPSPAKSQQSHGRPPKRPAFTLMPRGFHAPHADSGDASDDGETMMLDASESPALSTPFRCNAACSLIITFTAYARALRSLHKPL